MNFRQRFKKALDNQDNQWIIQSLKKVNSADISVLLEGFSPNECKHVFDLLPNETGAKILEGLEEEVRKPFIRHFTPKKLAAFVEKMDSDDGTDLLHEMEASERNEVIRQIEDKEKASHLMELLEYDEDVAGGLMAKELIKVNDYWNIFRCIEEIRKQAENVEKIYSVYVVDDEDTLLGKVSLKKIILTDDRVKVADILPNDELVSVDTSMSQEEVASIMQKYDLEVVPVVNAIGKLVGRITIDDVIDIIRENAEEERQLMTGVSSDVEEVDSVWRISKARLPWLVIGMAGGLIGAQFMSLFENEIIIVPALAFFIPLITASGGNVGIQASSIVVQSLAYPHALVDSMMKRLLKVFFVAVVNGVILSLIVFSIVALFIGDPPLAATVAIALFAVVLLASFVGTITPLLLSQIGANPALASGPFITTMNDLLGIAVYFLMAHLIFNL